MKIFFDVVAKEPAEVNAADVFAFLAFERSPRRGERVVRLEDAEPGLAALARRCRVCVACTPTSRPGVTPA